MFIKSIKYRLLEPKFRKSSFLKKFGLDWFPRALYQKYPYT